MSRSRPLWHLLAVATGATLWLAPPAAAFDGTVTLPLPARDEPSEPYIAVNPSNPSNAVVVSRDVLPGTGLVAVQSWVTFDGGGAWTRTPIVSGRYEGKLADASDPVVAFGSDDDAHIAGLAFTYSRRYWQSLAFTATSGNGGRTFPSLDARVRTRHGPPFPEALGEFSPRQSWNDKEWIAVDNTGGPFNQTLYLAWDRVKGRGSKLLLTRAPNGANTFTPPIAIEQNAINPQIAVRPSGVVDLVWTRFSRSNELRFEVRHAASTDGGASFPAKQTIAAFGRAAVDPVATLAIDNSGRLLACWSRERFSRPRAQIQCVHSGDGITWSSPAGADPGAPSSVQQLLPASTSQGARFWLTGYLETSRRTRVVLYRSEDGGATFTEHAALAERNFGYDDSGFVGDYSGLAATPDHVLATYVLAKRFASSRQRVYVSSLATP